MRRPPRLLICSRLTLDCRVSTVECRSVSVSVRDVLRQCRNRIEDRSKISGGCDICRRPFLFRLQSRTCTVPLLLSHDSIVWATTTTMDKFHVWFLTVQMCDCGRAALTKLWMVSISLNHVLPLLHLGCRRVGFQQLRGGFVHSFVGFWST